MGQVRGSNSGRQWPAGGQPRARTGSWALAHVLVFTAAGGGASLWSHLCQEGSGPRWREGSLGVSSCLGCRSGISRKGVTVLMWGAFPHHQAILPHQLGVLTFHSLLTPSTWGGASFHLIKGSSTRLPSPPSPHTSRKCRSSPGLLTNWI